MAGSVNTLLHADRMTLSDQKTLRQQAAAAGVKLAAQKALASMEDATLVAQGNQPKTVDIRQFQNILDAGQAAANDFWQTAALAVVGTAYTALGAVAAVAIPANRIWVFYGIGVETVPPPISRVTFRIGGALGNVRAVYDLEDLYVEQNIFGYFSEPVVYGPNDNVAIQVLCRIATGVLARVSFATWVIETGGQTIA